MSLSPSVRDNLTPLLSGKRVLLGITGSIAAFKACDLIRYLRACGAEVRVVLTESAENFVTPLTLETLSGNAVSKSLWKTPETGTHHIDAARWADLVIVAPATANTIGNLAHGLAPDLLSSELLAYQGPLLIAPAMNPGMWSHTAVETNIKTLQSRGVRLVGPTVGKTSCGEEGLGRMTEPEEILETIADALFAAPNGKHALVNLGPTVSALDPVRYLTNRSSGKMGAALCWDLLARGYRVTAVAGPVSEPLPRESTHPGFRQISVRTADEMASQVFKIWPEVDLFFAAAAVLDWDFEETFSGKIKKGAGEPTIHLRQNIDILAEVCERKKPGQFVVGFSAETSDPLRNTSRKLRYKGCDAIFVNPLSTDPYKTGQSGFESDTNQGLWIADGGNDVVTIPLVSKRELAKRLVDLAEAEISTRELSEGRMESPNLEAPPASKPVTEEKKSWDLTS